MNEDKKIIRKEEEEKERKRKKAFWLWFLLGLVLVTAISAFGFITFSSSTTPSSSSATSNSSSSGVSSTSNSSSTSTTPSSNSATPYSISYSYRTIQELRFQYLSGGLAHTVGLSNSGQVYTWGLNNYGQLGDGTTDNKLTPTLVSFTGLQSGETISDVFAGQYHTFVVTSNSRVYAWGRNNSGQLGDDSTVDKLTPTLISFTDLQNGETLRTIAAGIGHSLAVTSAGRVYAWGRNNSGQLGDGTTVNKLTPTLISFTDLQNGETIRDLAVGIIGHSLNDVEVIGHSLAVTTTGRLYAWGLNDYGQLGDGTTVNRSTPTLISFTGLGSGETIRNVAAGGEYSHAVTTQGRVYSWGFNTNGQLGDGTTVSKNSPTLISFSGLQSEETIRNVDVGGIHSMAMTTIGRVYTWGYNFVGRIGDGTTVDKYIPTLISFTGLEDGEIIEDVFLGNGHSLAVTTTGRVYAWGRSRDGQHGDNNTPNKLTPIIVNLIGLTITIVNDYLTVNFGETITLPNPTLEGYVFAGWFMDEALTIPYNLTTMPANDVMLYASFIPAN